MATPNRAPRKTAAQMTTNVASGAPVPGVNAQTYTRKTASVADGGAYMKQRDQANTGVTPQGFPDTKVSK